MKLSHYILAFYLIIFFKSSWAINRFDLELTKEVQMGLCSSVVQPLQAHLVFEDEARADAWISEMSQRLSRWIPDSMMKEQLLTRIQYEATRAELDPQLVLSIITVESAFNQNAISQVGALGLMQVMPFWLKKMGSGSQSLLDSNVNIRFGCTILSYYLKIEHNNLRLALQRYNGSLGDSSYSNKVIEVYNRYWRLDKTIASK